MNEVMIHLTILQQQQQHKITESFKKERQEKPT